MRKWPIRATLFVVAAGWIFSGSTAQANGFYLRAGGSLEGSEETRFKDKSCSSTSPAALYLSLIHI